MDLIRFVGTTDTMRVDLSASNNHVTINSVVIPTDEELEKSFAKLPNKKCHSKRVMEQFSSITLFDIMQLVVFCVNFEE